MTWIQTLRGRAVELFAPTPDDIDPVELATLASRLMRFGGHTLKPYTVAEHSCRVALECPDALQLAGLLHDAHEAYLGCDITRPLKELLNQGNRTLGVIELAWDKAIGERFGCDYRLFRSNPVKIADCRLLATEKRDLMAPEPKPWSPLPPPVEETIVPRRNPEEWFLGLLSGLTGEPIRRMVPTPPEAVTAF